MKKVLFASFRCQNKALTSFLFLFPLFRLANLRNEKKNWLSQLDDVATRLQFPSLFFTPIHKDLEGHIIYYDVYDTLFFKN